MKEICKFTPRAELEKLAGPAKFQLEDRPAYYHGGGFVVYYSLNTNWKPPSFVFWDFPKKNSWYCSSER